MILDDILVFRKKQLEREKFFYGCQTNINYIKRAAEKMAAPARDFSQALKKKGGLAIIAEVKKASPSAGVIVESFNPVSMAAEYERAGARAISVLTEEHFFKGSNDYVQKIKNAVNIPVLRKDFIFDPFQIYHARVTEADAVLLIADILTPGQTREFVELAKSLSLHVLAEGHTEGAIESAQNAGAQIIGVNNRDLTTFKTDLSVTERLMKLIAPGKIKVSESGVKTANDLKRLKRAGANAALVGEGLVRDASLLAAL